VTGPLRVEAPTADLAEALMQRLQDFPTEVSDTGEICEVEVTLIGNPDRAVVTVLNGVDEWLVEHELQSVRVHLDEHVYTLSAPRPS
jgi:hypothetical protein